MLSQREMDLLQLEAEQKAEEVMQEFEELWQGNRLPQQQPVPPQPMGGNQWGTQ